MRSRQRTAYELSQSQVTTPQSVVSIFWHLVKKRRQHLDSVLDIGAGDCRFATGGPFRRYVGVEIDREKVALAEPPTNGTIIHDCVFRHEAADYEACIGNPPYARHHDIQDSWKNNTVARLNRDLSVSLNKHCNLFVYFFCLALLKSRQNGLVALVIPYEWVSRPSAAALRNYIRRNHWGVSVYRFQMPIFEGVLTTASISIIDKAEHDDRWQYYDITPNHKVVVRSGAADSRRGVLKYEKRGKLWGLRGLSPGSQKVFTLTDGERIRNGLKKRDVVPCVTTLRYTPRNVRMLSHATFEKHFVRAGHKCWLVRSCDSNRSEALNSYLTSIRRKLRETYTCKNQRPWFKYLPHPTPQMLFSSGFTKFGPKILINSVGARAIGSVWGIHSDIKLPVRRIQTYLLKINFEAQVVAHARTLKKVEVRQLNAVLNQFQKQSLKNGRKDP
jgi:hypothetical protein